MKIYKSADYIKSGNASVFESKKSFDEEHEHEYLELVYCVRGSCFQYVNDVKYEMQRGDMLFINRGAKHRHFSPANNFECINVCVEEEQVDKDAATLKAGLPFLSMPEGRDLLLRPSETVSFSQDERLEIESVLQAFIRESNAKNMYNDKISDHYVNILFLLFLRKLHVRMPKNTGRVVMSDIIEFVEMHLHLDITLADVAKHYHYNKSYLSRAFKEKTGESFTHYVNKRRIAKAKELLAESGVTVEKVMETVGFNSRSMFYRTFKRFVGMTTAQYRAQCEKKKNKRTE